jgi:ribonucleoside-diphosphate reductase alpha chain
MAAGADGRLCAWHCGDPGVQYDTTINRWHTCPNSGRINASNPCSEYMFLDDTACNLASINLMKFRRRMARFDVQRFKAACRLFFIAQEILVDHASYPTDRSREQPPVPPVGIGLFESGQPDHVGRIGLRFATPRVDCAVRSRRLLHGAGQFGQRRTGGSGRAVRRYADNASRCCA